MLLDAPVFCVLDGAGIGQCRAQSDAVVPEYPDHDFIFHPASTRDSLAVHVAGAAPPALKKLQQASQPLPSPSALDVYYINTPTRLKSMGNYGGNPAPSGGPTWPVNMLQVNSC